MPVDIDMGGAEISSLWGKVSQPSRQEQTLGVQANQVKQDMTQSFMGYAEPRNVVTGYPSSIAEL